MTKKYKIPNKRVCGEKKGRIIRRWGAEDTEKKKTDKLFKLYRLYGEDWLGKLTKVLDLDIRISKFVEIPESVETYRKMK